MRLRSIGLRLTAWYLAVLAIGFGAFGMGSWYGMRAIAIRTVDQELLDRIREVEDLLRQHDPARNSNEAATAIGEHFRLDSARDLLQVADDQGRWLFRSPVLERADIAIRPRIETNAHPIFEISIINTEPFRIATVRVSAGGHSQIVQTAESLQEFFAALHTFGLLLWSLIPGLLLLAGAGGYWISRNALRPVDRITAAAESISIHNLAGQLEVPRSGDELQRLSETLNRMLGRLNESVQRMSQFTADASHELRAPVSVIRTTAELAVQSDRTAGESREDMTAILAESERVTRLIDSLLFLARGDAGYAEDGLQRELTDLVAGLRQTVEQIRPSAEQKGIHLSLLADRESEPILADAEAMRRLFFNLIDNAIKYTPTGGIVAVRLELTTEHAIVNVADTGIGIAEADVPHIFDRFWRADKVRSRGMGGAGLGLAIAHWISQRHNWTIDVAPGASGGTRFTVMIPR